MAGLLLLLNYQGALQSGYLPASWQSQSSQANEGNSQLVAANSVAEPQQATLGQHDFDSPSIVSEGITPLNAGPDEAKPVLAAEAALNQDSVEVPAVRHPAAIERAAPRTSVLASTPLVAVPRTKVLAPVAKSVARAPKAPAVPVTSTIKTRTGRYYVIAGAYSTLAHAEQGRKVLAHTGHEARVILPPFGSRLFRLTAADYPDLASAQREAQRLRVSTHCDYNTLKF